MTVTRPSPYLQSTGDYKVSPLVKRLADLNHRLSILDKTITTSESYKKAGPIEYRLKRFVAMLAKWDISQFNTFFKGRLALPSNPMGMLLFILFPCVVGSRVLRARERDKSGVETGDVLRRDIMTLIPFVFLLPALVNLINTLKQKRDGINMVHKLDPRDILPKAYGYSDIANAYDLNNGRKIAALIAEGNGKGLKRSVHNLLSMYENALRGIPGSEAALEAYRNFVKTISEMAAKGEALKGTMDEPKTEQLLRSLGEKAYDEMTQARKIYDALGSALGADNTAAGRKLQAKFSKNTKLLPEYKNALVHYAKMKRLPGDLLSILLTVVAIGYAPVAFNDYLHNRRLAHLRQNKANPFSGVQDAKKTG